MTYETILEVLESGMKDEYKLEEIAKLLAEGIDEIIDVVNKQTAQINELATLLIIEQY